MNEGKEKEYMAAHVSNVGDHEHMEAEAENGEMLWEGWCVGKDEAAKCHERGEINDVDHGRDTCNCKHGSTHRLLLMKKIIS